MAERRRIEKAQELSRDELLGIGRELGLSPEEMAEASVEVSALASPQPLTVTTSEEVLVLASSRPSFGGTLARPDRDLDRVPDLRSGLRPQDTCGESAHGSGGRALPLPSPPGTSTDALVSRWSEPFSAWARRAT